MEAADGPPGWERFGSCWARLDRANEHLDAFGRLWAAFLDEDPNNSFVVVDDRGSGVIGIRERSTVPQAVAAAHRELLYELGAAPDNCLSEVAVIHSAQTPPPDASQLRFSIYRTPREWDRNLSRLTHLSTIHREMLQRIQPYQAQRQDLNCLGNAERACED